MASGLSRLLAGAVVTAMSAGIAVTALAGTAAAAQTGIQPVSWAYTDSAAPASKFVNPTGDAPVGSRAHHTTRAYFTFDLSALTGSTIGLAQVITDEKSVAD